MCTINIGSIDIYSRDTCMHRLGPVYGVSLSELPDVLNLSSISSLPTIDIRGKHIGNVNKIYSIFFTYYNTCKYMLKPWYMSISVQTSRFS